MIVDQRDYLNFEQAEKLNSLGIWPEDVWINYSYIPRNKIFTETNIGKPYYKAPQISQFVRWLEEKQNIILQVFVDDDTDCPWKFEILTKQRYKNTNGANTWSERVAIVPSWKVNEWYETQEEAWVKGIDYVLEVLKEGVDNILKKLGWI